MLAYTHTYTQCSSVAKVVIMATTYNSCRFKVNTVA